MWTNFRKGTNVLLVKGTVHTGMKETRARTTTTSASSDIGRLKKSLKKKKQKQKMIYINCCLSVSLELCFSHLGGIVG